MEINPARPQLDLAQFAVTPGGKLCTEIALIAYLFDRVGAGFDEAPLGLYHGARYGLSQLRFQFIEDRLQHLEKQFLGFEYIINPYHIQPGLLLDVDITSIKRKKATLDGMANVLNEFLFGVSKGFQDAAFASFSRRRSTVRTDIQQSFAVTEDVQKERAEYAEMLNVPSAVEVKTPGAGVVDSGRRTGRSKPAAKRGGGRGRSDDALREI